jgi:hypothetical protein
LKARIASDAAAAAMTGRIPPRPGKTFGALAAAAGVGGGATVQDGADGAFERLVAGLERRRRGLAPLLAVAAVVLLILLVAVRRRGGRGGRRGGRAPAWPWARLCGMRPPKGGGAPGAAADRGWARARQAAPWQRGARGPTNWPTALAGTRGAQRPPRRRAGATGDALGVERRRPVVLLGAHGRAGSGPGLWAAPQLDRGCTAAARRRGKQQQRRPAGRHRGAAVAEFESKRTAAAVVEWMGGVTRPAFADVSVMH